MRSLVLELKVAAVAQRETDSALKLLGTMVKSIKEANFVVETLVDMNPQERLMMMKKKLSLVNELETLLNGLNDAILLAKSKMNSDQQV